MALKTIASGVAFGAALRRAPTANAEGLDRSGRLDPTRLGATHLSFQIGAGPWRSPSACSEIKKKISKKRSTREFPMVPWRVPSGGL